MRQTLKFLISLDSVIHTPISVKVCMIPVEFIQDYILHWVNLVNGMNDIVYTQTFQPIF